MTIYKSAYLLFLFLLCFSQLWAQTKIDSVAEDENYSYFSTSLCYVSNTVDNKITTSNETSALFADLSYYHKSGFYAGIMPSFYKSQNDVDLSLGYTRYFDSGLDITLGYLYHNSTSNDSIFSGIRYTHNPSFSVGYYAQSLYMYIDGYSLHGDTHNYFLEPGLGFYFDIDGIFTADDYLSFLPLMSVSFGTDFYIFEDLSFYDYYWLNKNMTDAGYEIEKFGYQSIDITFPISYTIQDFTFSTTFLFSSPGNKYREYGWENQTGFLFSVFYTLTF